MPHPYDDAGKGDGTWIFVGVCLGAMAFVGLFMVFW